jgi:serine O-acetyltransferase
MKTALQSHVLNPTSLIGMLANDLRCKALWCYESESAGAIIRAMLTDGTMAMVYYRLMQWCRRYSLTPLEVLFNRLNSMLCGCVIGRGAEFGPGFVIIHSSGIVINGAVRAGSGVHIEHQATIGAERRETPMLGDNVFIGAGAKIIGGVTLGDGVRVGANAVVLEDVPDHHTAVGVPARAVPQQSSRKPRRKAA